MDKTSILLPALIFTTAAIPSATHADTLEDAVTRAYRNNPSIEGNRALSNAAEEGVTQAKSAYGPTVDVNASHTYTYRRTHFGSSTASDEGFGTQAQLSLSQPLFTSGRLAARLDRATATNFIIRENLRAASQQLVLDVIRAYVSLRRDIALYAVAKENYEILQQQRDVTQSRYNLRDATAPDVEQTANRLELAAGRVITARAAVETSAARYRNLVGVYPGLLAPPPELPALSSLDLLYQEAETSNPDLGAAKYAELRSRAALAEARAQTMPQVTGFASIGRAPLSAFSNSRYEESVAAGVSLTMRLYSGGQLSSAVREAIERNIAEQQFVEQSRRDMRESLAANWNLYTAASSSLPRYQAAVNAALQAVDGVKKQEQSGIRTLRDVLDVTNDLLNARTLAAQAEADLYLRKAAVLRDAGLLTIDLLSDTQPHDPDSYRPGFADLAGLPLGPLLRPVDRLLLANHVKPAAVETEEAQDFAWPGENPSPLQPIQETP